MSHKSESNAGSVKAVKDRTTGAIVGYDAYLPRELSLHPEGKPVGRGYQRKLSERSATAGEARALLDAAIVLLRDERNTGGGITFADFAFATIEAKRGAALVELESEALANKLVTTWASLNRTWLAPHASFYKFPIAAVALGDLQAFVDLLQTLKKARTGKPLTATYVRQVGSFISTVFEQAKIQPNPAAGLVLPKKPKSEKVRSLVLAEQQKLFRAAAEILERRDMIAIGCGTGAGLRVGELLSIEPADVHLDGADPYLFIRYGGPHHSPPKGRKPRRVELVEPGLGFWREWMRAHYEGGELVFARPGSDGAGYDKHWPEKFPAWGLALGVRKLTSHVMRHTYAVSVLSGTWGHEPQPMEFVQHQLGHADLSTTERYYGAYHGGVWQEKAARMRGGEERPREPVTSVSLLGEARPRPVLVVAGRAAPEGGGEKSAESSIEASMGQNVAFLSRKGGSREETPSLTQSPFLSRKTHDLLSRTPQDDSTQKLAAAVAESATRYLVAVASEDPSAHAAGAELAIRARALVAELGRLADIDREGAG